MPWAELALTDIWRLRLWDLLVWEGEKIRAWQWDWGVKEKGKEEEDEPVLEGNTSVKA